MKLGKLKIAGFTLVEVMITAAIVGVCGAGVFEILMTGTTLFGKNAAINYSHVQGRYGLWDLERDLHASVSTPQLTDSSGNILASSTGPAAGISFDLYAGGPFVLAIPGSGSTIASTATSIAVITGTLGTSVDYKPQVGQILHIQILPTALLELQVTGVSSASSTSAGTSYTLTLASALGSSITVRDGATNTALNISCFLSSPVSYIVQNGQFVKTYIDPAKTDGSTATSVLSNSITSSTPFSIPTINGTSNVSFISVANFTATDPSSSNRGYKGARTPLTLQIPHFAQLTSKY